MNPIPLVFSCQWASEALWEQPFRPSDVWLEQWLRLTRDEAFCLFPQEISLFFTDNATVQKYNAQYRGQNKPTNVLSFPSCSPEEIQILKSPGKNHQHPIPMGDLLFAHETLQEEAVRQGISFESHLAHLIVHGMLHLLGYDHEQEEEAETMETLEAHILRKKGLPNPYESCML